MNIYTIYNTTHQALFETFFKISYDNINIQNKYKLIAVNEKDHSADCSFRDGPWKKLMRKKVDLILHAISENTNPFLYADADIVFLKDFKDKLLVDLKDKDILSQKDPSGYCAGLFVCTPSTKVKKFFEEVRKKTLETSDQVQFNRLRHMVNISHLNTKEYSNPWLLRPRSEGNFKDGKVNFSIDKSIKIFHANNDRGLDNKIRMIQHVQDAYRNINHHN